MLGFNYIKKSIKQSTMEEFNEIPEESSDPQPQPIKKARGGWRPNSGRKRRIDTEKLHETLDRLINPEEAILMIGKRMMQGDTRAMGIYMNYRFGKPVQIIEQTTNLSINDVDISKMIQFENPTLLDDNNQSEI